MEEEQNWSKKIMFFLYLGKYGLCSLVMAKACCFRRLYLCSPIITSLIVVLYTVERFFLTPQGTSAVKHEI